jgi:plasmid stabilization system protein ParE
MMKIIYHDKARDDVVRLVEFLIESDIDAALATFDIIEEGVSVLKNHPEIGRPTESDVLRELVISRGRTGYVALYEFDELREMVVVLRLKHQREDGFK